MQNMTPKALIRSVAQMVNEDPLGKELFYPLNPKFYELYITFGFDNTYNLLAEIVVDFDFENDHTLRCSKGQIRVRVRYESGIKSPAETNFYLEKLSRINALAKRIEEQYKDVEVIDWWDDWWDE